MRSARWSPTCLAAARRAARDDRTKPPRPSRRRRVLRLALGSPETLIRRRHPAGCSCGHPNGGRLVLTRPFGPRDGAVAARILRAHLVARRTNAPPASLPAELPDRTTERMGAPITIIAQIWSAHHVTSARGCDHCPNWKGAGQGCPAPECSIAHGLEAAGRRRWRAIPAARRAALQQVSQCPTFPGRARTMRASG